MQPFIEDGRIDVSSIPQVVIDQGRVPGLDGIFAFPMNMNLPAMLYNASLLEELGLQAPRNMNLDQFINLSREIYALSGVRTDLVGAGISPHIQMEMLLRARGVSMYEGTQMGGSPADYVEFFEIIRMGIEEGWHIRPEDLFWRRDTGIMDTNTMWYPPDEPNLRSWNAMAWASWINAYINNSPEDMVVNITTIPSSNPRLSNFGRAGMFLSMSAFGDNQDAAAEFINFWINSVEANSILLGYHGAILNPVVADAVFHLLDEGARIQNEFVNWVNAGNSSLPNSIPSGAWEVTEMLRQLTSMVAFGEISPEDAAQQFFDFGNEVLW